MSYTFLFSSLCALLLGYFLGSIPFGLLFVKLAGLGDLRKTGSGNIGATNVLRTGRKDLALLTLVFDAGKAALAAFLAGLIWGKTASLIAAAAAFIGHCWSFWLKFQGGKGIATFFGMLFYLDWRIGVMSASVWLLTAFITRYSSLAALVMIVLTPIIAFFLHNFSLAYLTSTLAIFIFWLHRQNIERLINNTEPKIKLTKE